jgi:hypothetical protein
MRGNWTTRMLSGDPSEDFKDAKHTVTVRYFRGFAQNQSPVRSRERIATCLGIIGSNLLASRFEVSGIPVDSHAVFEGRTATCG